MQWLSWDFGSRIYLIFGSSIAMEDDWSRWEVANPYVGLDNNRFEPQFLDVEYAYFIDKVTDTTLHCESCETMEKISLHHDNGDPFISFHLLLLISLYIILVLTSLSFAENKSLHDDNGKPFISMHLLFLICLCHPGSYLSSFLYLLSFFFVLLFVC